MRGEEGGMLVTRVGVREKEGDILVKGHSLPITR